LLDDDVGPNTGGMGAYAPVSLASPQLVDEIVDTIFNPTLKALRDRDATFTGLLYAGLMITDDGPGSSSSTAALAIPKRRRFFL
jgi:phosphoribosylamine--glycine ligase